MPNTNKNPGCLTAILNALGLGKPAPAVEEPEPDTFPYRLRDDFLSPAELSLYKVIKNMVGDHLVILTKVSLADIFFVSRPHENRGAINKIDRKHVDFLICNPQTLKPLFGIELDDSSHQRPDRIERDEFVDGVFDAANLPLVHLPVKQAYSTTELGEVFRKVLKQNQGQAASVPESAPTASATKAAPTCPKCGVPMVLRTAERGPNAGKQFYGCTNYPKCREVRSAAS